MCCIAAGIAKYLLFAANFAFMVSGIAILALGAIIQQANSLFDSFLKGSYDGTAISMMVVGSAIILIGFCGCCGACLKSVWLLNIYAGLLIAVFLAEIGIGIVALQQVGETQNYMKNNFEKFFIEEYNITGSSKTFDDIHKKFSCCAVYGPEDFVTLIKPPIAVPKSCNCNPADVNVCSPLSVFKNGCKEDFTSWIEEGQRSIGIVVLCVAICEIVAIVFACCLSHRYKSK